jgi:hypothetical protein
MALSGYMEIYGNRAPVTAGGGSKTYDIVGFSDALEEQNPPAALVRYLLQLFLMLQRNLGFLQVGADSETKIGSLDSGDATVQSANCEGFAPQT